MKKIVIMLSLGAIVPLLAQTPTPTSPTPTPTQPGAPTPMQPGTPFTPAPNQNTPRQPPQPGAVDPGTVQPGQPGQPGQPNQPNTAGHVMPPEVERMLRTLQTDIEQALPLLHAVVNQGAGAAVTAPAQSGQAGNPRAPGLPPTGNPNQRVLAPGQPATADQGRTTMSPQTIQLLAVVQRNLQQTLPVINALNAGTAGGLGTNRITPMPNAVPGRTPGAPQGTRPATPNQQPSPAPQQPQR